MLSGIEKFPMPLKLTAVVRNHFNQPVIRLYLTKEESQKLSFPEQGSTHQDYGDQKGRCQQLSGGAVCLFLVSAAYVLADHYRTASSQRSKEIDKD